MRCTCAGSPASARTRSSKVRFTSSSCASRRAPPASGTRRGRPSRCPNPRASFNRSDGSTVSTAVLTVDPSLRLKDALGLGHLDGRPRRVPLAGGARLDAQLLDVKRTFDDLVRALAGDPAHVQRILGNRLYQNLSGTL